VSILFIILLSVVNAEKKGRNRKRWRKKGKITERERPIKEKERQRQSKERHRESKEESQ